MKYIYLILIILLLPACSYTEVNEDYNYLPNNSLRFIRTEHDTSLLINKDNTYYLLLLNKDNINIDVDYLIKLNNVKSNIKAKREYYLNKDLTINSITFKINDKVEILFNNKKFCIYIKNLDQDNYSSCDFLYLYDPDENFYITLNNNLLVLFYQSYTKFNYKFMYHLSTVWIDSYTIDPSSYTTLTISRDNFEITSNEIRGKTIHKKPNS